MSGLTAQPICRPCFNAWCLGAKGQILEPCTVVSVRERECCLCMEPTEDGIMVRVDPDQVPFPEGERIVGEQA